MGNIPVYISLIGSLLFFAFFLISLLFQYLRYLHRRIYGLKNTEQWQNRSRFMFFFKPIFLFLSVWCLRFSVGYYSELHEIENIPVLTPFEEIFNSFVNALKTFSLDENYAQYINAGKNMISGVFGVDSPIENFYGIYAAILNVLGPIVGGTILYKAISEIFPKFRYHISKLNIFRNKYYFSELNDNSLALAKSIVNSHSGRNVFIVFTDTYGNDDDETASERIAKAKSLGAICLKDDITYLGICGRSPKIFLIDESETNNLKSLTALLEHMTKPVRRSEIYVFSSDKSYSKLDENVSLIVNQSQEKNKSANEKEKADFAKNFPVVIPVNGIRNMASNLFLQVPLYEPLINGKRDENGRQKLTVTILGSSVIGTEFFLTTYWCGQILDCDLSINVISKEERSEFEKRINYINPQILRTAERKNKRKCSETKVSCAEQKKVEHTDDKKLLLFDKKGKQYSDAYFSYNYVHVDITSGCFIEQVKLQNLFETDYFIVALGSDEKNLDVANKLRQIVGTYHLSRQSAGKKTVISYVVYNSDLRIALNKNQMCRYNPESPDSEFDICMHAFGDLDSVFGFDNILLNGLDKSEHLIQTPDAGKKNHVAEKSKNSSLRKEIEKVEKDNKKNKLKRFENIYSYQSNIAREFHLKYKIYSAGLITSGVFSGKCDSVNSLIDKFSDFVFKEENSKEKETMLHRLAWLEHRRWCAYMRTKGFVDPSEDVYDRYFGLQNQEHDKNEHRYNQLKFHPCLVECSQEGINALFDSRGLLIAESEGKECAKPRSQDCLNFVSKEKAERLKASGTNLEDHQDFKHWDYPQFDISARCQPDTKPKKTGRFDIDKLIDNMFVYLSEDKKYYISTKCFIKALKKKLELLNYKKIDNIDKKVESIDFYEILNEMGITRVELFGNNSIEMGIDDEMKMIEYDNINIYAQKILESIN